MLQEGRQFVQLRALPRVHHQRGPRKVAITGGVQFGKDRHQFDGQIIDAIETHVFEGFEYGAFTGAGQPGENYKVSSFMPARLAFPFHRGRA
jgi:hypothetical protein